MTRAITLLLGIDESEYGHIALESQHEGRTACALSVGSDALSPSRLHKARHDVPNEDAALAIDDGPLTLLAVADAHYGHEASHEVLRQIAELADPIPDNPLEALELLRRIETLEPTPSETTLALAILDHDRGQVHGYAFGDSSVLVLDPERPPRLLNPHNVRYLRPDQPDSMDPRLAQEFQARLAPGSLLLAYTDGIDACHYDHPESSITLAHIHELQQAHGTPAAFLEALTSLALAGISPHPGGQDNIAAVCTNMIS